MGIDERRLTDAWYRDWRDVFVSFHAQCLLAPSITFPLPRSCQCDISSQRTNQKGPECIQRYEVSLSRSYIPVRTSISSLRLDVENIAEKKWSRQSSQVAGMIIQLESTCALGVGRQLLVALSIGMGVRTQARSSFTNLELGTTEILQS